MISDMNDSDGQRPAMPSNSTNERLELAADEITAVHSLAAASARILEVAGDPRSSADDLAAVIDPAMTARLLRLANSAHFGRRKRISVVHDAVLVLGFAKVRAAAMSSCIVQGLAGARAGYDAQHFWFFSVVVGQLTELVASGYRRHRSEAFTAGLLHGLGRMALAQFRADDLEEAKRLAEAEKLALPEAEDRLLGFNDAALGGAIASRWQFPDSLVGAIANHHLDPRDHEDPASLAADVARARQFARAYGLSDGLEQRQRRDPDPEWLTAPLSNMLALGGKMPGLRDRATTFVEQALGVEADEAA